MIRKFRLPVASSTISVLLIVSCVLSLLYGLSTAQKNIQMINETHIPLMENSSVLVRVNSDILNMVIWQNMNGKLLPDIQNLRGLAGDLLSDINEIIVSKGLKPISRDELSSFESVLLESKSISNEQKSKYFELQKKFKGMLAVKIEKVLSLRDSFISRLILNNTYVFYIAAVLLALWLVVFSGLFMQLKKSIGENNRLLDEVFKGKNEIEGLLRVLSHDVSTPISVIMAYSRIDLKQGESEKNIKKIETIKNCANTISDILIHVREMQALKDHKVKLSLAPVSLKKSLSEMRDIFQSRLDERNIVLNLNMPEQEPFVVAEPRSLRVQVLGNLISNSAKFSPNGSVIDIDVKKTTSGEYVVSIADQGIGIPDHLISDLFENDKPTTREGLEGEKGTGFGLPIVKAYLEMYGARISVESRDIEVDAENSGTTFTLHFKAARDLARVA